MRRIRAVVLNYNGDPHVFRSVAALLDTDWPTGGLDIVVVDNASGDGSDVEVRRRFPNVTVVRQARNTGFPANNVALRHLDDDGIDYVALVNNDAFVTPGWLTPLVCTLDADPQLGAACPKLLFAPRFRDVAVHSTTHSAPGDPRRLGVRVSGVEVDGVDRWRAAQFPPPGCWGPEEGKVDEDHFTWTNGAGVVRVPADGTTARLRLAAAQPTEVTLSSGSGRTTVTVGSDPTWQQITLGGDAYDVVQNAGSLLLTGGYGADRGFLEVDRGQYGVPADVAAWCGGGVLLRAEYLVDVGLFDERFFAYYEDTDLAWRGQSRAWRYRYVPTSVIRHQHATTSVDGSGLFHRYVERNRLLMLTKNAPAGELRAALVHYVLVTASYARSDIVRPLLGRHRPRPTAVVRRLRSLLSYTRQAPAALRARRRIRRRALVGDDVVAARFTPREVFDRRALVPPLAEEPADPGRGQGSGSGR